MLLGAAARADDEEVVRRLSGYHFDDDTWNYIPVHDPATGLLDAIVAIAKPDATIGDNLNTVLFIRSGTEFEAWSWRNATRGRAVYSAKMILNVSDEDDANWLLEEDLPWLDDNQMRPPVPYMAGMLTDDPLFEPVMESENPAALVSMLQEIGYPVAMLRPSEGGGEAEPPCPETAELRSMREAIEWALANQPIDDTNLDFSLGIMMNMLAACPIGMCDEYVGPWVVVPTESPCNWIRTGATVTGSSQEGLTWTCTYVLRKVFKQTRSRTVRDEFCQTYVEKQCNTMTVDSPAESCSKFVPMGSGLPVCYSSPLACPGQHAKCSDLKSPSDWSNAPACP